MGRAYSEIIYFIIIYLFLIICFYVVKNIFSKNRTDYEIKDTYEGFKLNYHYVIYGFTTVVILTSATVLAIIMLDLIRFDKITVYSLSFFIITIIVSIFYFLKSRI